MGQLILDKEPVGPERCLAHVWSAQGKVETNLLVNNFFPHGGWRCVPHLFQRAQTDSD